MIKLTSLSLPRYFKKDKNFENFFQFIISFVLIGILIGISHFLYFSNFGLYEDDYDRIPFALEAGGLVSGSGFGRFILNHFLMIHGQRRPLHDILIAFLAWIGNQLGGFHSVYLIGYFIITVNAFLFYTLLKRLPLPNIFIITGVLAFSLFPADTTQPFLTHSLGIQPSITFLLIAFHCYLSGKEILSYFVLWGCLFCYEPIFPVFLAAPLLKNKWNLRLSRKLIKHILLMGVMVVCVIFMRKLSGDSRTNEFDVFIAFKIIIIHLIIGPYISLKMFLYRSLTTLQELNLKYVLIFFPSWIGLLWLFSKIKNKVSEQAIGSISSIKIREVKLKIENKHRLILKFLLIGIIMTILAYPFSLSTSVTNISGRGSRVHAAAVIGTAIVCACVCSAIWFIAQRYRQKSIATAILATFFTLLMGFGLLVQQDYVLSWQYQRAFWTDINTLCPDMTENTVIIVDNKRKLRDVEQIKSFFARPSVVMNELYKFPKNWKSKPKLYYLRENWKDNILSTENLWQLNQLTTTAPGPGYGALESISRSKHYTNTDSSNIILLASQDGKLNRRFSITIHDQVFPLKQKEISKSSTLKKGILYQYMIKSSDEGVTNYLQ